VAERAGDDDAVRLELFDGDGNFQWLSDDGEGIYVCGGPWRSYRSSWLGTRDNELMRR
jgi:hypothetical protein